MEQLSHSCHPEKRGYESARRDELSDAWRWQNHLHRLRKSVLSFVAVTSVACRLILSVALPMANEMPLMANIGRSFSMSPMVATRRSKCRGAGHRPHKRALVVAGRGDVEIIGLRADGSGLAADRLLHRRLRSASRAPDRSWRRRSCRRGPDRARNPRRWSARLGSRAARARHIRRPDCAYQPLVAGEQPDVDAELSSSIDGCARRPRPG